MSGPQTIARAGLIVTSAFMVSRILGYVRVIAISGVAPAAELDTFFAAFRIPDLIFQLVAAGALSSALIPIVTALFTAGEAPRAWRVVSTVINLMLIALAVLAVVMFVLAPQIVGAITPGFGPVQLDRTIELTRIMLLSPIFLALGAVATSVLNAGNRFTAAAMAPIVYNLAIIGGAILLGPSLGVEGLAIGVVAGSICHLLVQMRPLLGMGFRYQPKIEGDDPEARHALDPHGASRDRPRGDPDHVHRRHLARDAGRPGGGLGLQLRVRPAPDPARGHRCPARHRGAADPVA